MKTILSEAGLASKFCGKQKYKADARYLPSAHRLTVPCEDGTLWFHTLTGAMVLLQAGEGEAEPWEEMVARWFLVPEGFSERAHVDEIRNIARLMKSSPKHKTHFTILTTTDCNARCFYCYEMGIRRFPMTPETARDVADYIIRASGGEALKLTWFGGEPLYNRQAIEIICDALREKGADFESRMVSNGYYLDAETVRTAVRDWHLKRVQITLDGTEAIYNRTKAYIDADENPYRRVLNNIEVALEAGIAVTIRLNMDARNADDLSALADDLTARFGNKEGLQVYVAQLHAFTGGIHAFQTQRHALDKYLQLRDKLRSHGMLREEKLPRGLKQNHCMADNDASEVILPDGRTGRCEHFNESIVTGTIYAEARDEGVVKAWKERLSVPKCDTCVLYPICTELKMCEWNSDGCSEITRLERIEELKRQILAAYRDYKNGGKIDETEEELHFGGTGW